ncbi:MAG: hypothetical protein GC150_12290 [Rhizobiales bacterium]|nr:hypothetical protein [Hyphomicrobiales bacterium]
MSDVEYETSPARGAPAGEVPVNPYSLLEAVNSASGAARNGWALFLGIMTYVLIAVAGVTHKDLLLNSRVDLPILQVEIELTRFFIFAPLVLLFIHFGLLIQHVMLARKVIEFDAAVRPLEATRYRTHPLRLELHSYFFTIALAGPRRSSIFGAFLHAMIWLSLMALPVVILLYIQIVFLPYHDEQITWVHRLALVTDVVALIAIGVFLRSNATGFFSAFGRVLTHHPINTFVTGTVITLALLFSFFVATIPDERLDRFSAHIPRAFGLDRIFISDDPAARPALAARYGSDGPTLSLASFAFDEVGEDAGSLKGFFHRNLIVIDEDLVPDEKDGTGEVSLNLRGRDLRNAVLNRSDLHRADLTGADLTGARLIGTDLRNTRLSCADNSAILKGEALEGDQSREFTCTRLRDAVMKRANLSGANLQLAFLAGADLEDATLDFADLRYSELTGVNFSGAYLRRANLSGGAQLVGANFLGAVALGADFNGSNLQGADFSSAALQGALFSRSRAQAASFQGAELDGATFAFARLQGADFSGAVARGVDFSLSAMWQTVAPGLDKAGLADGSRLKIEPLQSRDINAFRDAIEAVRDANVDRRLEEALARMEDKAAGEAWATGPDAQAWRSIQQLSANAASPVATERLMRMLVDLACQVRWRDGSVAGGVIQRSLAPDFKGDARTIYDGLTHPDCAAASSIPADLLLRLATEIEKKSKRPISARVTAPAAQPSTSGLQDQAPAAGGTGGETVVPQQQPAEAVTTPVQTVPQQ